MDGLSAQVTTVGKSAENRSLARLRGKMRSTSQKRLDAQGPFHLPLEWDPTPEPWPLPPPPPLHLLEKEHRLSSSKPWAQERLEVVSSSDEATNA